MNKHDQFVPQPTDDGSLTFYSEEFQEAFHSSFGAKQEAEVRYIQPCEIKHLAAKQSRICLLDICYGLGYNSAAALEAIWSVNPECKVELIALEISADVPRQAVEHNLLAQWKSPVPQLLTELGNKSFVRDEFLAADLLLGDARQTIQSLVRKDWQADAIFLDPFSPRKCPQLWTVEFIGLISKCLAPRGKVATYSCSAAVRAAFVANGLNIRSIVGAGRKSPGTLGSYWYKNLLALSQKEQEHLKTRAAIPYRDHNLDLSKEEIISQRQREQETSVLESTSQWRKRWFGSNI